MAWDYYANPAIFRPGIPRTWASFFISLFKKRAMMFSEKLEAYMHHALERFPDDGGATNPQSLIETLRVYIEVRGALERQEWQGRNLNAKMQTLFDHVERAVTHEDATLWELQTALSVHVHDIELAEDFIRLSQKFGFTDLTGRPDKSSVVESNVSSPSSSPLGSPRDVPSTDSSSGPQFLDAWSAGHPGGIFAPPSPPPSTQPSKEPSKEQSKGPSKGQSKGPSKERSKAQSKERSKAQSTEPIEYDIW